MSKKFIAGILVLLFFRIFLFARDVEIVVEDGDLELPLEGAVILSWDGTEYTCDEEGRVMVTVPEDRPVVLRILYPGYESRRLTIPLREDRFAVALRLGGDVIEGRELVIEAPRPGTSETKSGRSVAISGENLSRTAEIGIVQDVMTSIKLLPGVGYAGSFNAMPSIRGGEPGDLMAVLDGFYISQPYHWGGMASIFDPRMVESAQLSHGVFSSRYGHTISGLLEVRSKQPSSEETELDVGISTSAVNLNLSFPFGGRGGLMAMGKVTYWDPFVWLAKQFIAAVEYVRVAPYIRSIALTGNYRFTPELELSGAGFFGADGAAAFYDTEYRSTDLSSQSKMSFDWENMLGFLNAGLAYNPRPTMILKASAGVGFLQSAVEGYISNKVTANYSQEFKNHYQVSDLSYHIDRLQNMALTTTTVNLQGRVDFDWDLGRGFLFAAGVQELYSQWMQAENSRFFVERPKEALIQFGPPYTTKIPNGGYASFLAALPIDVHNHGITTSAYSLVEYSGPRQIFGAELGLRMDHLYFIGRDFTIQTMPVVNPRLNLDFNVLKDKGPLDAVSFTLGTGLFSSQNDLIFFLDAQNGIDDFELTQNRSWTSIAGTKIDLTDGFTFTLEGYFKYVFDRAYEGLALTPLGSQTVGYFDGEGYIWGFDMMLQKLESRFWDGWISYSFIYARYRNPSAQADEWSSGADKNGDWYYPSFHRFHTLNLILNIKPVRFINIAFRFGLAGGTPRSDTGRIQMAPLLLEDGDTLVEVYKRGSHYSDTNRMPWSIPMDMKFSWYFFNSRNKVQGEIYLGIENLQTLFYKPKGNTTFNRYTGKEDEGSSTASYGLPIPMISFGYRWSY
ncbi:TonB-dependent receptor plug domain-containing protein [Treponema sp. TIM-1]|uniref:TonB-dependent receptor plug domain-containing protein n=1 Tax=Treponema sp. TIM-1 TaxID=2898417 RepID=UPI0039809716